MIDFCTSSLNLSVFNLRRLTVMKCDNKDLIRAAEVECECPKAPGCRLLHVVALAVEFAVTPLFEVTRRAPFASGCWRRAVPSTCPQCLSRTGQMFNLLKESSHQKHRRPLRNRTRSAWVLASQMCAVYEFLYLFYQARAVTVSLQKCLL